MAAAMYRSNLFSLLLGVAGGQEKSREARFVGSEAETRTAKTVAATREAAGAVPGSLRTASGG